jgi:hypothetical protein
MNSSIIGNVAGRLILALMHKTHSTYKIIILKHKITFYTYQKTVSVINYIGTVKQFRMSEVTGVGILKVI